MAIIAPAHRAAAALLAAFGLSFQTAVYAQIVIPPTNYWIGPEAACDYPDIQSAIDDVLGPCFLCAPTEDRFLLSLNYVHSGKFELNDSVAIIGGYTQCEGTQTGARNTLTSSGPGALIRIDGSSAGIDVYLGNLTLLGTGGVSDFGGVIHVDNRVTLTLENSRVTGGQALQGGGIAMHAANDTQSSTLVLRDATVSGNVALIDGGGIWCEDGGEVDFQSGLIAGNRAENRGGGIGIEDCRLTGSTINETREISSNTVSRINTPDAPGKGGGIFARGSAARVELGGLLTRTTIEGNLVAKWTDESTPSVTLAHGGGLHLQRDARAVLRNVQFIGNEAPSGGAISLERGARLDMDRTSGPCLTSRPSECSSIVDNTASGARYKNQSTASGILVGRGSAIQAVGFSGEPGTTVDLRRTTLRDNLAMDHDGQGFMGFPIRGSMIDALGPGHRVRLEQNLIFSNLIQGDSDGDGDYFDVNGTELELIHNTIAFNEEAESIIERGAPITLVGNVFWNPDNIRIIGDRDAAALSACNVTDGDIPAGIEYANTEDDPLFVDFSIADFRLSQGSPAINRCNQSDSELGPWGFDIEGRLRPVDDGGNRILGDYDSGALEHHLSSADEIDLTVAIERTDDGSAPGAAFDVTLTNVGLTAAAFGNFGIGIRPPTGGYRVTGPNWACELGAANVLCTYEPFGELAPGQSAFPLAIEIDPDASGECELVAFKTSSDQPDTDFSNNSAVLTVPDCDADGILPEDVFADSFEG